MTALEKLSERIAQFRDARDWKQFHKPKDMTISLMLESAEVAEIFQWAQESEALSADRKQALGEELSDVLYWVLLIARDFGIDLERAFEAKMAKNEAKYPIDKARGKSDKYSELDRG